MSEFQIEYQICKNMICHLFERLFHLVISILLSQFVWIWHQTPFHFSWPYVGLFFDFDLIEISHDLVCNFAFISTCVVEVVVFFKAKNKVCNIVRSVKNPDAIPRADGRPDGRNGTHHSLLLIHSPTPIPHSYSHSHNPTPILWLFFPIPTPSLSLSHTTSPLSLTHSC